MRSIAILTILGVVWADLALAAITGTRKCNHYICVTGLHDDVAKVDRYTLDPPEGKTIPQNEFGWMAMGFGETMANSPMVIVWPNDDGTFTLSQRQAPDNIPPSVVANPPRKATIDKASSWSNTTSTSITFTLPSASNATDASRSHQVVIFAVSSEKPSSASPSATFLQHDVAGAFQLSLAAPWNFPPGPSTSTSPNGPKVSDAPTGNDADDSSTAIVTKPNRKALLAHAICGALATMVFLPVGTIIPRLARGYSLNRWWFPVHGVVNGVLGGLFILIAYAIARSNFHQHAEIADTAHRKLGLALFLLVLFQIGLGIFVHWYKSPFYTLQTKSGRGPSNFIHMVLGTIIVIIGWVTAWKGMDIEWPRWSGTGAIENGYKILWGLVVAGTIITYLIGLIILLPKQQAMERQARLRHTEISAPRNWQQDGVEMARTPRIWAPLPEEQEGKAERTEQGPVG